MVYLGCIVPAKYDYNTGDIYMYHILTGEDIDTSFLKKIMELDARVYKPEYIGTLENMEKRYLHEKRSFVVLMDEADNLAGYINFFPVTDELWDEIVEIGMDIRDDDIDIDKVEIEPFSTEHDNRLFIISIVIDPDYRSDKRAVITLTDGWIQYMNELEGRGYHISGISATAVSEGGQKFLRTRNFRLYREINGGDRVYVCDSVYLEKLLRSEYYYKTYKHDAYIIMPFADNEQNDGLSKLRALYTGEIPRVPAALRDEIDACIRYECSAEIGENIENIYLGEYMFLHTSDEYPEEDEELLWPDIMGEEKAHVFLIADERAHLYNVLIFIADSKYSASQVADQISQKYIMLRKPVYEDGGPDSDVSVLTRRTEFPEIRDERDSAEEARGVYRYRNLNEWMLSDYGLISIGTGKLLLCMSKLPSIEGEMTNVMAGETWLSYHQDFRINAKQLQDLASYNRAMYDYYEAYMSERVVAFVLKDDELFSDDSEEKMLSRIQISATYAFIMEITTFQNTALRKLNMKVAAALTQDGNVSYNYISKIYKDYVGTLKYGRLYNYRYYGTRLEAEQIKEAFENDELMDEYAEQQEFLQQFVELSNAQTDKSTSFVINVVAILLAIMSVQSLFVDWIKDLYLRFDIPLSGAEDTFNVILIGGIGLVALLWFAQHEKGKYERKQKLLRQYERVINKDVSKFSRKDE